MDHIIELYKKELPNHLFDRKSKFRQKKEYQIISSEHYRKHQQLSYI